jgi:S-methyl-5-thioribose kinase
MTDTDTLPLHSFHVFSDLLIISLIATITIAFTITFAIAIAVAVAITATVNTQSVIVMQCLDQHVVLRNGLTENIRYPKFAEHISEYLAQTLFHTSDFALPAAEKKVLMKAFADNHFMCKLTEEVIFTCPYVENPSFANRWSSPQLDDMVLSIRNDANLKHRVSTLKQKFLCNAEALIHGDLHTGSVMINENDTRIIDAEFAFMGPMAFDIGLMLGNLLLSYCSKLSPHCGTDSKNTSTNAEADDTFAQSREYLVSLIHDIWTKFESKFIALWDDKNRRGDVYPHSMHAEKVPTILQASFTSQLFRDAMGFAGCEMIRRVIGVAHVTDLENIEDAERRTMCEHAALRCARWLIRHCKAIDQLIRFINNLTLHWSGNRALVLVSKYPTPGTTKTRLAASIGDDAAAAFAKASLVDLLQRFGTPGRKSSINGTHGVVPTSTATSSSTSTTTATAASTLASTSDAASPGISPRLSLAASPDEASEIHQHSHLYEYKRFVLFAPTEAQSEFESLLHAHNMHDSWNLLPMQGNDDIKSSDLGRHLKDALQTLRAQGYQSVVFVGNDCVELRRDTVSDAFQACRDGKAFVSPAHDGGYVLLGVPPQASSDVFDNIEWSTSLTCVMQIKRLQDTDVPVRISEPANDVDTIEDLRALKERLTNSSNLIACSHVRQFFKGTQV